MQKRWVKVAAAVAAVLILIVLVIPFLVNADTFRPRIEDQLSSALGRKVALGHLSFSLFSGSLVANDISIADDPAFSTSPFLGAKSLHIGVEVAPLIFHRQVRITTLTVESPTIQLVHGPERHLELLQPRRRRCHRAIHSNRAHPRPHRRRIENQGRQRHRLLASRHRQALRLYRHQSRRPTALLCQIVPLPAFRQTSRRRIIRSQRQRRTPGAKKRRRHALQCHAAAQAF